MTLEVISLKIGYKIEDRIILLQRFQAVNNGSSYLEGHQMVPLINATLTLSSIDSKYDNLTLLRVV